MKTVSAEYWDIITAEGVPTGKRIKRCAFNHLLQGEYHLVVHIWVKNSNGEYLIQRRSIDREPMSGEWAATGGSVQSGETSTQAAIRELKEELGISLKDNELKFVTRMVRKNSVVDIWMAGVDVSIDCLELQEEEVMDAKWVNEEEFKTMISNGEFHNYGREYFKHVFSE